MCFTALVLLVNNHDLNTLVHSFTHGSNHFTDLILQFCQIETLLNLKTCTLDNLLLKSCLWLPIQVLYTHTHTHPPLRTLPEGEGDKATMD